MAKIATRPDVALEHPDERLHRRQLAQRANAGLPLDGSRGMNAPLQLETVGMSKITTPDPQYLPANWAGGLVLAVEDDVGARDPYVAYSDGTQWYALIGVTPTPLP